MDVTPGKRRDQRPTMDRDLAALIADQEKDAKYGDHVFGDGCVYLEDLWSWEPTVDEWDDPVCEMVLEQGL